MAEVEEPQFTSLSARIAALNQSQSKQHQTFGKRAPPPIPTSSNRPNPPERVQTTNNPPLVTYGSAVSKVPNNQPEGAKKNLLPPPPVDRDNPNPPSPARSATSPSTPRNLPPPLPGRKASSPSLPPRNGPTQMVRHGSNSSTISNISSISGISLSQTGSSINSASSVDSQRKLPPPLEHAKLPPLPPTRREVEEKAKVKGTGTLTRSIPTITHDPPVIDRQLPPMPLRANGPPSLPSRPSRSNLKDSPAMPPRLTLKASTTQPVPVQPPRRLPPAATGQSILSMGFGNKEIRSLPGTKPVPNPTPIHPSLIVRELDPSNFDSVVMSGKPAFVDFYAPYCRYCKELDPIWKELGDNYAFASDRLSIVKVDVDAHKSFLQRFDIKGYPTIMYFDGNSESPEKYAWMRDLEWMSKFLEEKTGIPMGSPVQDPPPPMGNSMQAIPPPINLRSKPSATARPPPSIPSGCLICRDYSGPDQVASQYPRLSLPLGGDMTGYLAEVLCGPFTSHTDKARAIFTWLHHNIAYDTVSFFGGTVKYVDPKDTILSGVAVCGGYAGLYVAIALKAGLEAVMVSGHGKGYSYSALKPGDPIPPCNPSGHAWNAVRIDGGEWKLMDPCWGAGNVGGQVYNKKFSPECFTMSNEQFGIKHFPKDASHFYRADGTIPSWESYMIGPVSATPLHLYGAVSDHDLSSTSFTPPQKDIPVRSGETIRFQFSKVCEHWDHERNGSGKPYIMVLHIHGVDGRKEDHVAFENNEFWWWCDVPARDLGAPGQKISVFAVKSVQGKDARGMSIREYLSKKGKCGMGYNGICAWDLV